LHGWHWYVVLSSPPPANAQLEAYSSGNASVGDQSERSSEATLVAPSFRGTRLVQTNESSRPTTIFIDKVGYVELEWSSEGSIAKIKLLSNESSYVPAYRLGNPLPSSFQNFRDGTHSAVATTPDQQGLKVLTSEEDEEVRRSLDELSSYIDFLMWSNGYDFDLNRSPEERARCVAACEQTCSDGTTTYGTVIGVVTAFAPQAAPISLALLVGVGYL
jgi:hypothetical protein